MARSIGIRFGEISAIKWKRDGLREMRCTPEMQGTLVGVAEGIAARLNSMSAGVYDVGPYGEGVYGVRHHPPMGAHAFVRTADEMARYEQSEYDYLNWALGGY